MNIPAAVSRYVNLLLFVIVFRLSSIFSLRMNYVLMWVFLVKHQFCPRFYEDTFVGR